MYNVKKMTDGKYKYGNATTYILFLQHEHFQLQIEKRNWGKSTLSENGYKPDNKNFTMEQL